MGCATGIVKNLVFLLNFLCSIVGLTLIVAGSLIFVTINKIDSTTKQNNTVLPSFILALGVLIFIVSFLGCCGVCQRNQCMLITYAVILILFFVIQLAVGIYGYTQISGNETKPREILRNDLDKVFKNYKQDENIQQFFNSFQKELTCCGVRGPSDYEDILYPVVYPVSCCENNENEVCNNPVKDGCADKLFDIINKGLKMVSYISLGICVTEIVSALFAICLVNSYRNESRRGF